MLPSEIETVMGLSKYDRINHGTFRVWSNDSVFINKLKKLGIKPVNEFNFVISLLDFNFLPKHKSSLGSKNLVYPDWLIQPNDNHDKETLVTFTQSERQKDILHIFTEDEYFLTRCKKYNLPYKNEQFISNGIFYPLNKKRKLTEEHKAKLVENKV